MKIIKLFAIILVALFSQSVCSQVSQDSNHPEETTSKESIIAKLPLSAKTKAPFRYFYYPNLQAYFDNLHNVYYYKINGQWMIGDVLPPNYGGYSLFNGRRVILEGFVDDKPYDQLQIHKTKYPYNAKGRFAKEEA